MLDESNLGAEASLGELTFPPNSDSGEHTHGAVEIFYVLKGEIHFLCEGKAYACDAGTLVHVPRGTVHGFSYGSGGGQMLEITGPGALAAQMFTAVDNEIPTGPPDLPKLLDVLRRNGVIVAA
jgi:quercetin dioxygenase-like cupin family protein